MFRLLHDTRAASAAEYALILALVGSAIGMAAFMLGGSIGDAMNNASTCIHGKSCGKGNAADTPPGPPATIPGNGPPNTTPGKGPPDTPPGKGGR